MAAFDAGGDAYQRQLRTIAVGSAALLAPLVALNLWVTVVGFDRFDPDDALLPSLGSGTGTGIEDVAPFVGAVASSIAAAIIGFYVAVVTLADRFGRTVPTVGPALRAALRSLPRLGLVWIVGHWWQPLMVWILVASDIETAATLGFWIALLAWGSAAATLHTVPVMVAERLGPIASLKRAWSLFRRSVGTALGFVGLSTVFGSLLLLGLALLAPALEASGFLSFGGIAWLVQGVLVQLGVLLVMPLIAACTAQCYVEVRLECEGLDLLLDADAAFDDSLVQRDAISDGAPA